MGIFDFFKKDNSENKKNKDGNREGPWKIYHDNGQLKGEGSYVDDKQEGLWKHYHENGQLDVEGYMKNGIPEGVQKTYHKNGQLEKEVNIKDGKIEGILKIYDESGNLTEETFFKDGKEILEKGNYVDVEKRVEWRDLDSEYDFEMSRDIRSKIYSYRGKLFNGTLYTLFDNGNSSVEGEVKNGLLNGVWKGWYENGQLKEEGNWREGKKDGKQMIWYDNGKVKYQEFWKEGKLLGTQKYYGESGILVLENNYDNGKLISSKTLIKNKLDDLEYSDKELVELNYFGYLRVEKDNSSRLVYFNVDEKFNGILLDVDSDDFGIIKSSIKVKNGLEIISKNEEENRKKKSFNDKIELYKVFVTIVHEKLTEFIKYNPNSYDFPLNSEELKIIPCSMIKQIGSKGFYSNEIFSGYGYEFYENNNVEMIIGFSKNGNFNSIVHYFETGEIKKILIPEYNEEDEMLGLSITREYSKNGEILKDGYVDMSEEF